MHEDDTLDGMAKKNKAALGRPRNPNPVKEVRLFVEIDERIKDLLDEEAVREGRSLKSQLSRILIERFTAAGLWPPEGNE
jgi:hypothetical protein